MIRTLLRCIFILLLAGCNSGPSVADGPTPTPIPAGLEVEQPMYTVQRGTLVDELSFTARVAPVREERLFFRADGFVDRLLVQRNQAVQEGELLIELEMADLQRQLDTALLELEKAQLQSQQTISRSLLAVQDAELALSRARSASPDPTILQAQFTLTRSLDALNYLRDEYNKALNRPWETQESLDNYAHQVTEAERNLQIAQASYDTAVRDRSFDLQQLNLAVSRAQLDYQNALNSVDPRLAQAVEQLQAQVAEHQILAPFDGVVLSIATAPGTRATAFNTVIVFGDLNELEARAELTTDQVRDLQVGQHVSLRQTNVPGGGATFDGEVVQLPLGLSGNVQDTDRSVHISLGSDAQSQLSVGMLVQAVLIVHQADDALWLPPAAIQTFQSREFVIVQEPDGTQRRVDVVTGIHSDERVEIVSGLEEGQTVVGQ